MREKTHPKPGAAIGTKRSSGEGQLSPAGTVRQEVVIRKKTAVEVATGEVSDGR
jgi:hypothetical protein